MIQTFTPEQLRRTGSLKWTGITSSTGAPTIGAWVAEMDFGTSPRLEEVMISAIRNGLLGYQPKWLAPRLAEATTVFQAQRFDWQIAPEEVRLVESVLSSLRGVITHFLRPQAPVIVPTPAYMPFLTIPKALGHPVIEVPSLHGTAAGQRGWMLDLEGIRAGLEAGAGLMILCNPWNPVGRVFSVEELTELHELLAQYEVLVFSDEIHSPLVLADVPFVSYASLGADFAAHTVTATAASKGWNIAGLPSAQLILPNEGLRERWDRVGTELQFGASTIGTLATIAAYREADPWQDEVRRYIDLNMEAVEQAIANSPIDFTRPEGGYLSWWGFEGLGLGDNPSAKIRELAGIAVNEGASLGADYSQWARFNFACSHEVTAEIIERMLNLIQGASLA